ncbi:siderophore biosynthesis PLP-dependent protein, partial [Xanthomonas perforans]|nr:siderophore biosynthesis PLP-dependent protein [Xanthomonas perforans]
MAACRPPIRLHRAAQPHPPHHGAAAGGGVSLHIDTAALLAALPQVRARCEGPICAYVYDLAALDA